MMMTWWFVDRRRAMIIMNLPDRRSGSASAVAVMAVAAAMAADAGVDTKALIA
jgi:hypothetical protein